MISVSNTANYRDDFYMATTCRGKARPRMAGVVRKVKNTPKTPKRLPRIYCCLRPRARPR